MFTPGWKHRLAAAAVAPVAAVAVGFLLGACGGGGGGGAGGGDGGELVVYAGRNENLVRPLLDRFAKESGVDVRVRYGETSDMLATLVEEGDATRADVFISQDAGALAKLAADDVLAALPKDVTNLVDARFRDPRDRWVGVTGRVRVMAYNTDRLEESELPQSVFDLVDARWKGRVGIAPTNASFIAFVSALREVAGEEKVRAWLEGLAANGVEDFDNNVLAIAGVADGTVDIALVNHYYLFNEFREKGKDVPVANFHPGQGRDGEGTFVNVSGVGVLKGTDSRAAAEQFVEFLLSEQSQRFFREETAEYPLRTGVDAIDDLPPIDSLKTISVPLSDLGADYESTVELIKESGVS